MVVRINHHDRIEDMFFFTPYPSDDRTLEERASLRGARAEEDTKGARWMPWHRKPTKDVTSCDKPR